MTGLGNHDALIVIDMQNDFLPCAGGPATNWCLPNTVPDALAAPSSIMH